MFEVSHDVLKLSPMMPRGIMGDTSRTVICLFDIEFIVWECAAYLSARSKKPTAIRLIAVRETVVSRQSSVPHWGHHSTSQHYRIGGFKRGPLLGPRYADRYARSLGQPMWDFQVWSECVSRWPELSSPELSTPVLTPAFSPPEHSSHRLG